MIKEVNYIECEVLLKKYLYLGLSKINIEKRLKMLDADLFFCYKFPLKIK